MLSFDFPPWMRRAASELGLWIAIGLVMAVLGPFGTAALSPLERTAYWVGCIVGGGVIGIGIDEAIRRLTDSFWIRVMAVSVLMTPPVTVLVWLMYHGRFGARLTWENLLTPWFEVFVVCFAAMLFRQLVWTRRDIPSPATDEDPLNAFRKRLSARRRQARLIAVEAEDHYLRVHTYNGDELITARFGDALSELANAAGFRTHRSWWVAADAIDSVRWLRGRGEARLKGGLVAPISRSQARQLKTAGWF
jgi:hypothetical protein